MKHVVMWAALLLVSCDSSEGPVSTAETTPVPEPVTIEVFDEIAERAGLIFVHQNGASGEFLFPEIMGSGAALIDYDGDGDLDVYLVQSGRLSGAPLAGSELSTVIPVNRLFRNELIPAKELRFTDQSAVAGVDDTGYGMGVAVADWDNDGDQDLYVTNVGPNIMYRNNGDGTFSDISSVEEKTDESWSTSASFVDYDRDGDLDLYVTNYVTFSLMNNSRCRGRAGRRDYCDPTVYAPERDRLWRNDDGEFVDVSKASGILRSIANGLGVTAADFDGDDWPDIYVANDQMANILWINQRDGTFQDRALSSGCAYNADGAPEASMGVTAGDFDVDGDEDLFVTHLDNQTNTVYRNNGDGFFNDVTNILGLSVPSLGYTGFGTDWIDVNNDGRLDLFSANGAVAIEPTQLTENVFPYRQKNQLFINDTRGVFVDASIFSGAAMQDDAVSRGAAFGDIDNDGDTDIVVANNNGHASLLLNNQAETPWLQVQLTGINSNRDALGARVSVLHGYVPRFWRRVHTDGSYLSASDPRVHFGLSGITGIDGVLVHWPSGRQERWQIREINTVLRLEEGSGITLDK